MAKTRAFTYNNGNPIPENLQIGDLAFGFLNSTDSGSNYDDNPGGKKWWMGPDEENKYIIGKDVPSQNQPTQTPEGNIGSVEFWATTGENDTQFINLTNIISGDSFTTTQEAYGWLEENGYFTNYPYLGEQTSSLWTRVRVETKNNNTYNTTFARYISSSDSLIMGNGYSDYVSFNNLGLKGNIYNFSSNNIISGSTISLDYTSSYILPGSSSRYKATEIYGTDIDYENNKLFARMGGLIGSTTAYLVKYNLDDNSIENEVTLGTNRFNDASETGFLHYESHNSRLYNFYYSSSIQHLQVYNSNDLSHINESTESGFDVSSNDYVNSNPYNGEFLMIEPNITPNRVKIWNFDNITSPTQTTISLSGVNWSLHNEIERPLSIGNLGTSMPFKCQFPFSPIQKRYYIPGFQSETNYNDYDGKGNAILVIDAIDKSIVDVIYLGGVGDPDAYSGKGVFLSGPLGGVYDELRDYIWTINFDLKLVVVSCKTHQIVGEFEINPFNFDVELSGNGSIPNSYNVPWLALDNKNKLLYASTKLQAIRVFDLTDAMDELP
jgi:hypothetical protein